MMKIQKYSNSYITSLPREISPDLSFKIPINVENNFRSMAIEDSFISQGSPREIGDKL